MKIKQNLRLITVVPLVLIFCISLFFLIDLSKEYQVTKETKERLIKSKVLKNLSLNLVREKGLSIIYQLSNSQKAKDLLFKQRNKSDILIQDVIKSVDDSAIIVELKKIDDKRRALDNLSSDLIGVYSYYDNLNDLIINRIDILLSGEFEKFKPLSNAYFNSVKFLESLAKERDFITKLLAHNSGIKGSEIDKILNSLNGRGVEDLLRGLTTKEQEQIKEVLNRNSFNSLMRDSEKMKREIFLKMGSGNYPIKPIVWFENETKKITTINTISNIINSILIEKINQHESALLAKLIFFAILLLFSLYAFYVYVRLNPYLNSTIGLERLLDKIIDYALMEDTINLGTTEGIEKAYAIIEESVDKIAVEKKKAQKANASKSIFLANMSHEIRTPINGIIGFTELLKKSNLSKEAKEYVNIIDKSTNNLLEIINNILDLSKIENNKIDIEEILFSPIEEFENSVSIYIAKAADKDINLSLNLDLTLKHYLIGDPTKIKEILHNLINNAIKFTPHGGEVEVSIKRVDSQNPNKEKIYFEVKDNGIGIDDDKLEDIFNAFSQADSTITRKYGGTGLGLTISSNYVALMGGHLEVKSKINEGSVFYFTLEFLKEQPLKSDYKDKLKLKANLFSPSYADERFQIYISEYLNYFGIEVNGVADLKKIDTKKDLIVVKADLLSEEDFDLLENIKIPILLILKTPYQNRLDNFKSEFVYPVCEPLIQSRVFEILNQIYTSLFGKEHVQDSIKDIKKVKKPTNKNSVLVAEDNEINQTLLAKLLQYLGLQVVTAKDGLEAYHVAKKKKFDLIFMDIAMPILNGITATHKIREFEKEQKLSKTPIIAITANALKGDKEKFLNEGFDDYISKPFREVDIINILEKYDINYYQIDNIPTVDTHSQQNSSSKIEQIINKNSINKESQNILIFKKSKIETKIFEKVVSKLYDKVITADSIDEFYDKLAKNSFKVIMLDKEIDGFDLAKFLEYSKGFDDTILLLFRSFDSIIDDQTRREFDEVLINSADSEYLSSILNNYLAT